MDYVDLAVAHAWFGEVDEDHEAGEAGADEAGSSAAPAAVAPNPLLAAASIVKINHDAEHCGEPEEEAAHGDETLNRERRLADNDSSPELPSSPRPKKKFRTGDPSEQSQNTPASPAAPRPPPKTATNHSVVPWEVMFERLVAYKDRFGVRCVAASVFANL
jgi:hypothetical protein